MRKLLLLSSLFASATASAQVYTCTDPQTGRVIYSNYPGCTVANAGQPAPVQSVQPAAPVQVQPMLTPVTQTPQQGQSVQPSMAPPVQPAVQPAPQLPQVIPTPNNLLAPIFQALKWPLILIAGFGVLSLMLTKKQGSGRGRRKKNARWREPRMEHASAAQPERVFRPVIKKPVDYGNARFCLKNKTLLSEREQGCYWRLVEHLSPDFIVLAQVGFSQILSTKGGTGEQNYALYGTMRQKVADFVVCRQDLSIVAVIELDDSSHRGKEEQDKKRDAAVRQAGLLSFRLPNTPGNEPVKNLADVLRRMYLGANSVSSTTGQSPAAKEAR
ncbi:DUF2726 domain-containing protein [Aquitalea sp. ASV11]|uniref:DUF2726 domain-containing protein n=1 Tax=Aquitalea sp. ASV11 TaxID=2795103 RepID=UPI0018EBD8CD|nr:DUF2726 domain-containing protein [Aquitalea sp. ASV11]